MSWVEVDLATVSVAGFRRELVLVEDTLRQQIDFWEEIRAKFGLSDRLTCQRYLRRGPSGGLYDIVFIGRSDEPFPSGMEFWYLAEGFGQLPPKSVIDSDLWDFGRDLVAAVELRNADSASLEQFHRLLPQRET